MRKLLYALAIVLTLVFVSCSDDGDEPLTTMVNVKYKGELAYPSIVRLYDYEEAKKFDKDEVFHYGDYQELLDENGNIIEPQYTSDKFVGANTFEDIKQGKYIIVVLYKPDGFSWPMFYYYGYKIINVDKDNNMTLYNIDFEPNQSGTFIEF